MTDDLIERLREQGRWYVDNAYNLPLRAAERIEELEAWKAAEEAHHHMLRAEAAENARIIGMSAEREMALRGEVERLRNAMVVMDNTVRELTEALREMFEAVCGETGFAQAVRAESGIAYPWPALDLAEAMARAALEGTSHE